MNLFNADKIMNRLDQMLDHAISGSPVETDFDETRMSALETKLSRFLAMTRSSQAQLSEEKARVDGLISDISHQTKTPIANILLYAQLLEERELADQDKACVTFLVDQAEKLNFLIASLVKTSRLETGIISVMPKETPVQPLIDGVFSQFRTNAQDKGVTLACTPTQINAVFDCKWTAEALGNIVDNAIKYTAQGGTVSVRATAYQLFCSIDVSDTGIGISEEETAQIFTRFYRSPSVSDIQGVGIGLYLAREIVRGQGGYIKVRSEMGKGSTFSLFLPMKS